MQLSTAIPTVIAAMVMVIISKGILSQPMNPSIIDAAKMFGISPMIATVTDWNKNIIVNKMPIITKPKVRI